MIMLKLKEELPTVLLVLVIISIYFVLGRGLSTVRFGGVATILIVGGVFWGMFLFSKQKLTVDAVFDHPVLFFENLLIPIVLIVIGVELLFL